MRLPERSPAARFIAPILAPGLATLLGLVLGEERTTAAALVYLLAVLGAATVAGLGPGIGAAALSFLGLNFFFTPPRHTLSVGKTDDIVALVVFLSVGVVTSSLVALGLAQRTRAERRELEARTLHAITSRLLGSEHLEGAVQELAAAMCRLFGLARCEVRMLGEDGAVSTRAASGEGEAGGESVSFPLNTGGRQLGSIVLVSGSSGLGEAERRVAGILAKQTAAALERGILEREARENRVAAEAGRVRRALLGTVSHDFRTPLASIKTSLSALSSDRSRLTQADAGELVRTALEETERLERLVSNLLDLTRIRSGALSPERVSVPVEEVLEDALSSLREPLTGHPVHVSLRPDLPMVSVDPVQVGQVFRNVIENAAKFAPRRSEIRIAASRWQDGVELRVSDRGPGIAKAEREAVFEEFYRLGDDRIAGTGLGLALARAIVDANDGAVWIEDTPGGGATVVVRLPVAAAS